MSAASKAHTDALVADLEHDLSIMRTSRELYSAKAITRHEEIVSRLKMHSQLVEILQTLVDADEAGALSNELFDKARALLSLLPDAAELSKGEKL